MQAFYKELNKALAILTVFPGDRYYKQAASSTVATAISAGVPLVVNAPFLRVYNFVLPGAVVVANDSSHAIALQQILGMAAQEWEELALEVLFPAVVVKMHCAQVLTGACCIQHQATTLRRICLRQMLMCRWHWCER